MKVERMQAGGPKEWGQYVRYTPKGKIQFKPRLEKSKKTQAGHLGGDRR